MEGKETTQRLCCVVHCLSSFTTDSSGQLHILRHDGHTLGMDRAQVSIFEQSNQVRFASFLKSHDGSALESQVSLEVLSDFTDQTLERQLSDQQLSRFLVSSDFSESNSSWSVSVRLLHTTSWRCTLSSGFRCQLLSWGLATGWFTSSLFCSCHCEVERRLITSSLNFHNA